MGDHPFASTDIQIALGRRYVVDREVAVGGQGAVFRATREARPDGTASHDVVALKLHIYPGQDLRVQREITAMESLLHPNLARLIEHGYCEVAGRRTRYVAWEFIEGKPLSERLKDGRLLESEVLSIGRDVSAAIEAIWSRRIVHGDIKPSNIILRNSGGAVLIDLGAAKHLKENAAARRPFGHAGYVSPEQARSLGTQGYFSPEQARGEKALSCASDIFSLGLVMVQCLIGRHPTNYNQRALADGFRASDCRLAVSTGLVCMLDKMLSARPSFRPLPAALISFFQNQQQRIEAEFATGARLPGQNRN